MNLAELRDYGNWVGKDAATILRSVVGKGGWLAVFPCALPTWASRVRNYFNVTPAWFHRVDKDEARSLVKTHHTYRAGLARFALSGDVYRDEARRVWFEMATGGAAYHYEGEVTLWKKLKGVVLPKSRIPIFKLISPDGSGGSGELILDNPRSGQGGRGSSIAEVGQVIHLRARLVLTEEYQATYNYSETIATGLPAHELRDVKPHTTAAGFYLNPPPSSALAQRVFPEKDPRGVALAGQI